jgi:hypothetical protein
MNVFYGICSIIIILLLAAMTGLAAMGAIAGTVLFYGSILALALGFYIWTSIVESSRLLWSMLSDKFLTIWPR